MYIKKIVDGSPSGDVITSDVVPSGHAIWHPVEKPSDPNPIQEYVEDTPEGDVDNGFYQTWTLQNKTFSTSDEETAANTLHNNIQWDEVRSERNHRLAQTDWEITKHTENGTAIPESLKTYRQELRDITDQADPFDITWPTKPDGYA